MKRSLALIVIVATGMFSSQLVGTEGRLPSLICVLVFTEGSFFGYGPPQVGDMVKFDLNRLSELENKINFEQAAKIPHYTTHYIPLEGLFVVVDESYHENGTLQHIRYISSSPEGHIRRKRKITLDFNRVSGAGKGSNYFRLWIIDEHPSINSVAKADCDESYEE